MKPPTIVGLLLLSLLACGRTITPAELDRDGTRTYEGTSKGQVMRAAVTALKTLGYDVTLVDDAAGRIKTAPKLVVVHAYGSQYSARATGSSLAWTLDVTTDGHKVIAHAEPRGYEAGQTVEATRMNADYVEGAFDTLFHEISDDLGVGKGVASPQGGGASARK